MSEPPSASWRLSSRASRSAPAGRVSRRRDRLPELPDRLLVRRARLRPLARPPVVRDRVVAAPRRLGSAAPPPRARRATRSGNRSSQHVDDPPVELLARALEQRLVRRLLHQRVLEGVRRLGRLAAREEDLRVDQAREPLAQARLVHPGDGGQQRVAELPPEHRRPLRHLLRRREPIEPRHQRVGEASPGSPPRRAPRRAPPPPWSAPRRRAARRRRARRARRACRRAASVPASVAIISRAWRLVSRASWSVVRFERAGQGGVNSGRAVATKSTRAVALCAMRRPSSSSDEASHQCRSSTSSTSGWTGAEREIPLRQQLDRLPALQVGAQRERRRAAAGRGSPRAAPRSPARPASRSPRSIFSSFSAARVRGREGQPLRDERDHRMKGRALGVRAWRRIRARCAAPPRGARAAGRRAATCRRPPRRRRARSGPRRRRARSQRSTSVASSTSRPTKRVSRPAATSRRLRTPLGCTTR